jgi:hypothetical protein
VGNHVAGLLQICMVSSEMNEKIRMIEDDYRILINTWLTNSHVATVNS